MGAIFGKIRSSSDVSLDLKGNQLLPENFSVKFNHGSLIPDQLKFELNHRHSVSKPVATLLYSLALLAAMLAFALFVFAAQTKLGASIIVGAVAFGGFVWRDKLSELLQNSGKTLRQLSIESETEYATDDEEDMTEGKMLEEPKSEKETEDETDDISNFALSAFVEKVLETGLDFEDIYYTSGFPNEKFGDYKIRFDEIMGSS